MSKKQYATPADRLRAYRERQKQAAQPAPEPVHVTADDLETVEQASRAAGVPRDFKLSAWKRAAKAFLPGETGSIQAKVKALRSLCKTDKEMRKKILAWLQADSTAATKKFVAAQGWELTDGARISESEVDVLVREMEAAAKNEPQQTTHNSRGTCGHPGCTKEWMTDFFGVRRCDEHAQPVAVNGTRDQLIPYSPAPSVPTAPYPVTDPTGRLAALHSLREAMALAPRPRGGADYPLTEPLK